MVPGMTDDFAALLERGRTGDKRAVARLISHIEQGGEMARSVLTQLWPHTGRARIFGITGPPGAGKSTLTNALTKCWRAKGLRVGIIAVDPTSPFTGGAILGLVKGCAILFLCAWVLRCLGKVIPEETVEQTHLLKFFMTTNPVALVLGGLAAAVQAAG